MTEPRICGDCGCELEEDDKQLCSECQEADDWADDEEYDGDDP